MRDSEYVETLNDLCPEIRFEGFTIRGGDALKVMNPDLFYDLKKDYELSSKDNSLAQKHKIIEKVRNLPS
jgi:hypothetical protein